MDASLEPSRPLLASATAVQSLAGVRQTALYPPRSEGQKDPPRRLASLSAVDLKEQKCVFSQFWRPEV